MVQVCKNPTPADEPSPIRHFLINTTPQSYGGAEISRQSLKVDSLTTAGKVSAVSVVLQHHREALPSQQAS